MGRKGGCGPRLPGAGNTVKTDLTYQGFIRRKDKITRTRLDFNGAIGEDGGVQNVNSHRSTLKFDLFATPRFYVTLWNVGAYHDRFQNIDIQIAPSAGIGYHAIKKKKINCDLETSGGYRYTRYRSVEPGGGPRQVERIPHDDDSYRDGSTRTP